MKRCQTGGVAVELSGSNCETSKYEEWMMAQCVDDPVVVNKCGRP